MRIANVMMGWSDGSISLLELFVADDLMLVVWSAIWTEAGMKSKIMIGDMNEPKCLIGK